MICYGIMDSSYATRNHESSACSMTWSEVSLSTRAVILGFIDREANEGVHIISSPASKVVVDKQDFEVAQEKFILHIAVSRRPVLNYNSDGSSSMNIAGLFSSSSSSSPFPPSYGPRAGQPPPTTTSTPPCGKSPGKKEEENSLFSKHSKTHLLSKDIYTLYTKKYGGPLRLHGVTGEASQNDLSRPFKCSACYLFRDINSIPRPTLPEPYFRFHPVPPTPLNPTSSRAENLHPASSPTSLCARKPPTPASLIPDPRPERMPPAHSPSRSTTDVLYARKPPSAPAIDQAFHIGRSTWASTNANRSGLAGIPLRKKTTDAGIPLSRSKNGAHAAGTSSFQIWASASPTSLTGFRYFPEGSVPVPDTYPVPPLTVFLSQPTISCCNRTVHHPFQAYNCPTTHHFLQNTTSTMITPIPAVVALLWSVDVSA
ncbi:hypothetical protein KSP40_PGU002293 [Platanthera guangdongensis]|uniref:Uncharacterized protein n=1 Tax=Platanthera guangdongensis TaxID=2320717 RepID=A0ABR2M1D7_9ASPA